MPKKKTTTKTEADQTNEALNLRGQSESAMARANAQKTITITNSPDVEEALAKIEDEVKAVTRGARLSKSDLARIAICRVLD